MSERLHELARRWWAGELGVAGRVLDAALAPAEVLYRTGVRLRAGAYGQGLLEVRRVSAPVISVGNVAVGGTGKTPFAHWVALQLQQRGRRPAMLHGGYADDEPELHRRWSPDIPVVAEKDRVAGAERALASGADALVMDDGFQHRRLHRDLDIVLVSGDRWEDHARLLPRGPWREPLRALARAHLVVVTRKAMTAYAAAAVSTSIAAMFPNVGVAAAHLRPAGWRRPGAGGALTPAAAPVAPALLVSALAEPGLFAGNAEQAGATVADRLAFPDHHAYADADVARIRETAAGRPIVTTEKDWTRLQPLLPDEQVWLLVQEVVIERGQDIIDRFIDRVLE
jgi:tetraacyldisaccharide 4'-kinase